MTDQDEQVLQAAARGVPVRTIAASHGLSEPDVLALLDREAEAWFGGPNLRRELRLEVERLSRLQEHYYSKALTDEEGASTAAGIYVKLAERKATLVGLNAVPTSASVIIHQTSAEKKQTSTERIMALLERVRALPVPEEGLANGQTDCNPRTARV